ncbi:MAG: zf-HC2 domain-containing protein [Candidatus Omnitrophica bacterium]|nr:zf-HC2 domain-containing protein [Candidatus Omnitrophota bacterium]
MISCKCASRLISEQLDHPLPLSSRIMLKIHLVMCTNCVFFGRQIKALKNIIGRHADPKEEHPSPHTTSLSAEVQERIKSLMREENS